MTIRTFVLHRVQAAPRRPVPLADGAVFPGGATVVRWRDPATATAAGMSTATALFPSVESVEALYADNGVTDLVWGASTSTCKHCGRTIATTRTGAGWVHLDGIQRWLNRCHTADTGLPYGYDAGPEEEPCGLGCLAHQITAPKES
jgi:hypothetical protein